VEQKKTKKNNKEKNQVTWDKLKEKDKYNNGLLHVCWLVKFYNDDINIMEIERIFKEYEEIAEGKFKRC